MADIKQEQLEKINAFLKEKKRDEEKYPILKETTESQVLNENIKDFESDKLTYVEKLEYTSLDAVLTLWLNELEPQKKRKYAEHVEEMKKKGIFPSIDSGGKIYTIGHFRVNDHEATIEWMKINLKSPKSFVDCYNLFLYYLESVSLGWIKKYRQLVILNLSFTDCDPIITEWFNFALNDFYTAQDQSQGHPTSYRPALTTLQQSVEKGLKTFLLFNGEKINKTHDLKELLHECAKYDKEVLKFKEITELSPYAVKLRYPGAKINTSKEFELLKCQIRTAYLFLIHVQEQIVKSKKFSKKKNIFLRIIIYIIPKKIRSWLGI